MASDRGAAGVVARGLPPTLLGGAALIAALGLAALLAPALAPHDPAEQLDPAAARYLAPGSHRAVVRLDDGRALLAERVRPIPTGLEIERLGETLTLPTARLSGLDDEGMPERRLYLLGTDGFGRDVASRLVWAARTSLGVGALAAALAMLLGTAVGGIAGAAGGWVDSSLMRVVDALLAFPRLFLVIALAAAFESTAAVVVLVLGFTGWMGAARLVRAEVASLKRRDFVLAARGVGRGPAGVLGHHLLPNALTPVIVDIALRAGEIILVEAALSFIGLGVQRPIPTWGNMVADGAPVLATAWWISAFPGAAIALTVIGLNLTADGLRDWRDPRGAPRPEPR